MSQIEKKQSKRWLIVFLIYADFTTNEEFPMLEKMKVALNSMFEDILTNPIDNERSRLFVIMNSIKFVPDSDAPEAEDRTILYQIENNPATGRNDITSCRLIDNIRDNGENLGAGPLHTDKKLAKIFQETHLRDDEEIVLNTWDHGFSFGIFKDRALSDKNARKRDNISDNSRFPYIKVFWDRVIQEDAYKNLCQCKMKKARYYSTIQVDNTLYKIETDKLGLKNVQKELSSEDFANFYCLEKESGNGYALKFNQKALEIMNPNADSQAENSGNSANKIPLESGVAEILTNKELSEAIKLWIGESRKVGILIMTNCWMMNLHTMYALRDRVKCLVAPQGDIDCPGYNYGEIIRQINLPAGRRLTVQNLAGKCIKSTESPEARKKAATLNKNDQEIIDVFTIFAMDLEKKDSQGKSLLESHIDALKRIIVSLNQELKDPLGDPELKFLLKYVRSVCFDFSDNSTMMVDILNWALSTSFAEEDFRIADFKFPGDYDAEFIRLRDLVLDSNNPSLIIAKTRGKKVYSSGNKVKPFAVINLQPNGYSLFFPMYDLRKHKDFENLRKNAQTDPLMNDRLPEWKEFLTFIDPDINKVFI